MYKYEGQLIYESHDDEGIIEIIEKDGVRALHFGSSSRQSTMLVSDPFNLHLRYARAMMAWLLFKENPEQVLMVGLGGGSLAKFYLQNFSACKLRVVEYRRSVVTIARSHFKLPMDPRLKIIIADGGQFIRKQSKVNSEQYDLLVLDAFDHEGMSVSVKGEAFYDSCRTLLRQDGILVINLWGNNKALFQEISWHLGRVFNWKMFFLPVRERGNIIGFAFNEAVEKQNWKTLNKRARELEQQFQIEFPTFIRDIKRNNQSILSKIIRS